MYMYLFWFVWEINVCFFILPDTNIDNELPHTREGKNQGSFLCSSLIEYDETTRGCLQDRATSSIGGKHHAYSNHQVWDPQISLPTTTTTSLME